MQKKPLPSLTIALVSANVLLWTCLSLPSQERATAVIDSFAFTPARLSADLAQGDTASAAVEVLRSASSIFIHEFDVWHVGVNMAFLALFGVAVERRLGTWKYGILYGAAGILTCFVYFAICPDGLASFGASSAVCGVLGAFILLFARERIFWTGIPIMLLLGNIVGALNPAAVAQTGFGFWAHLSGYAIGALAAAIMTLEFSPGKKPALN